MIQNPANDRYLRLLAMPDVIRGIGSACRLQPRAGEVAERLAHHAVDRVQVEVAVVLRIAELTRPVPAGGVDPGRRPRGCGTRRPRPAAAAGCWGRSGARPVSWASGGSTGPQAASTSGPERYSFMSAANSSKRPSLSTSPSANADASLRPVRPPSGTSRARRHGHYPDTERGDP